jgi:hypothetical protein
MGYNENCYSQNCNYFNCCNYYGYCPEDYSYSDDHSQNACYYYYGADGSAVAGAVVGGLIGLIIIASVICFFYKKRQQSKLNQQGLNNNITLTNNDLVANQYEIHNYSQLMYNQSLQSLPKSNLGSIDLKYGQPILNQHQIPKAQ